MTMKNSSGIAFAVRRAFEHLSNNPSSAITALQFELQSFELVDFASTSLEIIKQSSETSFVIFMFQVLKAKIEEKIWSVEQLAGTFHLFLVFSRRVRSIQFLELLQDCITKLVSKPQAYENDLKNAFTQVIGEHSRMIDMPEFTNDFESSFSLYTSLMIPSIYTNCEEFVTKIFCVDSFLRLVQTFQTSLILKDKQASHFFIINFFKLILHVKLSFTVKIDFLNIVSHPEVLSYILTDKRLVRKMVKIISQIDTLLLSPLNIINIGLCDPLIETKKMILFHLFKSPDYFDEKHMQMALDFSDCQLFIRQSISIYFKDSNNSFSSNLLGLLILKKFPTAIGSLDLGSEKQQQLDFKILSYLLMCSYTTGFPESMKVELMNRIANNQVSIFCRMLRTYPSVISTMSRNILEQMVIGLINQIVSFGNESEVSEFRTLLAMADLREVLKSLSAHFLVLFSVGQVRLTSEYHLLLLTVLEFSNKTLSKRTRKVF